ncbi:MAG: amidohydrolase family protein [Terriglobales bacterium]
MTTIGAVDVLFQPAGGTCTSPETALLEMDEAGIAVAFIAPCTQLTCERQWACADSRLEDVARFLSASIRFAGLCGYNPFDAAESFREMESARALGFRGVFVQLNSFGLPLSDSRYYPLFAKASELQFPAMVQCSASEPAEARALRRIGRDFPELSLAIVPEEPTREVLEAVADFDRLNFVLNTSALVSLLHHGADLFNDGVMAGRCMWGSDGAPLLATLQDARSVTLPSFALNDILRANALRFFDTLPPHRLPRALDGSATVAER